VSGANFTPGSPASTMFAGTGPAGKAAYAGLRKGLVCRCGRGCCQVSKVSQIRDTFDTPASELAGAARRSSQVAWCRSGRACQPLGIELVEKALADPAAVPPQPVGNFACGPGGGGLPPSSCRLGQWRRPAALDDHKGRAHTAHWRARPHQQSPGTHTPRNSRHRPTSQTKSNDRERGGNWCRRCPWLPGRGPDPTSRATTAGTGPTRPHDPGSASSRAVSRRPSGLSRRAEGSSLLALRGAWSCPGTVPAGVTGAGMRPRVSW